ncbi:hypothetical protein PhaeoP18_03655 (plasmid) [Phaeobacter piscinae]|nr:hypothetical protein PhaeoP92_03832 [Phaeobacter inhibens]AUQ80466.1 hypothetical protein PhaeoP74_03834 [Phaeobacter inhibens]AUR17625.1 hypothetical protein PhaeoP70_03832 [Phaeobacter inhibens]AUR37872.1 hypothetical protein PhaeoP18_03655 [Phaeobacter piscinae]
MKTHDPCDPQFTIRYYEKIGAPPSLTRPVPETTCRVALKSETRRVRGYFLPLIMRFHCHRAYAFRALPGDVINRGKQTWLLIEGAQ